MCYCKLIKHNWLPLFYGVFSPNGGGNSHVMGTTVAMERSTEFRLLGFYTLCNKGKYSGVPAEKNSKHQLKLARLVLAGLPAWS